MARFARVLVLTLLVLGLVAPGSVRAADAPPAAGTADRAFSMATGLGFNGPVYSVALQPDGRIVVGGSFSAVNRVPAPAVARLNADGTTDVDFVRALGAGFDGRVSSVAIQPDGRIVVGGTFTTANGASSARISRLNPDGTTDGPFSTAIGTGFNGAVASVAVQTDGRILVAGSFTSVNGVPSSRIARLNPDGSVDATFTNGIGLGFDRPVSTVVALSDGRILVGGGFTTFNRFPTGRIARLRSNGALDLPFSDAVGVGFNGNVTALAAEPDGRIVAGGSFTQFSGRTTNRIARLESAGALDDAFADRVGAGFNGAVFTVARQPVGTFVIGGSFTSLDGTPSGRLARLGSGGSPDAGFASGVGLGLDLYAYALALQSDGGIIVGGNFTRVDSGLSGRIARLDGSGPAPTISAVSPPSGSTAGGTQITVTGTNLTGTTSVTVGGTPCRGPVVNEGAEITCTTGPGPTGPADVAVVTPGGQVVVAAGFTYSAPRQQAQPRGAVPRSLRRQGATIVNAAGARTVQGRPVTARVTVLAPTRRPGRCVQVVNGPRRRTTVVLSGACRTRIAVTYTAAGTAAFAPYRYQRVYVTSPAP